MLKIAFSKESNAVVIEFSEDELLLVKGGELSMLVDKRMPFNVVFHRVMIAKKEEYDRELIEAKEAYDAINQG